MKNLYLLIIIFLILAKITNASVGEAVSAVGTLSSIEYGTTVIVHGLNFSTNYTLSNTQNWTSKMARAVAERKNGGQVYTITDGVITYQPQYSSGSSGEIIIVFDWLRSSQKPVFGYSEGAGDALAALLIKGALEGKWNLTKLHFIGHSRGTVVSSEAIERLAYFAKSQNKPDGIVIDESIHFTTLDAHPWDNRWFDNIGDPFTAEDHDVNGTIFDLSSINYGVVCWENVGYADNYWHIGAGTDLNGLEEIPGCNNNNELTDDGVNQIGMNHGGIHTWYHGTIDTDATNDGSSDSPTNIDNNSWYGIFNRTSTGFNYTKTELETSGTIGTSLDPTYDDNTIFNGDFSKGTTWFGQSILVSNLGDWSSKFGFLSNIIIDKIPGWGYHGGGGSGHLDKYDNIAFNPHIELDWGNDNITHNYIYLPKSKEKIYFRYKVTNGGFNDKLLVRLSDSQVLEQSVRWSSNYKWVEATIPSSMKGTSQLLTFELEGDGVVTSEVWIDDIGFEKKSSIIASIQSFLVGSSLAKINESTVFNCELHAYDDLGNHTGTITDSTWVNEIPGSEFVFIVDSLGNQRQTLILPELSYGNEYRFELKSKTENQKLSLQLEEVTEDAPSVDIKFENIGITTQGNAEIVVDNVSPELILEVDTDGDGNVDAPTTPTEINQNFIVISSCDPDGTIEPQGEVIVNYGDTLDVTVTPNEGYVIKDVQVNGTSFGSVNTYSFNSIHEDYTIYAEFEISTAVEEEENLIKDYKLFNNYPNPFNPSTMIAYQIPERSFVKLSVYDVLGREVATLLNEEKSAGHYQILFNAAYLPSGMYFYKIQAGNYSNAEKMLLIK